MTERKLDPPPRPFGYAAPMYLLNAFDRLAVFEYSVKALIASRSIRAIAAINDKQIKEIEKDFKLDD